MILKYLERFETYSQLREVRNPRDRTFRTIETSLIVLFINRSHLIYCFTECDAWKVVLPFLRSALKEFDQISILPRTLLVEDCHEFCETFRAPDLLLVSKGRRRRETRHSRQVGISELVAVYFVPLATSAPASHSRSSIIYIYIFMCMYIEKWTNANSFGTERGRRPTHSFRRKHFSEGTRRLRRALRVRLFFFTPVPFVAHDFSFSILNHDLSFGFTAFPS